MGIEGFDPGFSVTSLKRARSLGGALVPEKTGSRKRKQRRGPSQSREAVVVIEDGIEPWGLTAPQRAAPAAQAAVGEEGFAAGCRPGNLWGSAECIPCEPPAPFRNEGLGAGVQLVAWT